MVDKIKKRRVSSKDWQAVGEYVNKEYHRRKEDSFRKDHERVWKEVDRQVSMIPMEASKNDINDEGDWHNNIELGELSRASEVLSADVRRLLFPTSRAWFESHCELPPSINEETGERDVNQKEQKFKDGALRAFMSQQHTDFGLKARVDLSVKEALHHGSFVVEVETDNLLLVRKGAELQNLSAPVWKPYSMWNAFPDLSPSVVGAGIFYSGSMILRDFMPMAVLKQQKGEGWMASQVSKVKTRKNKNKDVETEDVELIKYYGDVTIKRNDGDIYLPNSKVICANGTIVYYAPVNTPFLPVIFSGYERLDIRDPYFVSPITKLSPTQKMASRLANKFLDSIDLEVEPPITYDGNDPTFVANGGPTIAPGMKTSTKGSAKYEIIQAGNSQSALSGLQVALSQIAQGTAVDAIRGGGGENVEKTKAEITLADQRGEVRIVDFVDKLEQSLKAFLYMQNRMNRDMELRYPFYNPEMDAPDFMWMTNKELPESVHFEIVGAKGVLGEEQRTQKTMAVTAFASQNPLFADLLKPIELLKEAYQDAGNKNPERFLNVPNSEMEQKLMQLQQQIQEQAQQVISQYEGQIHELKKELDIQKAVNDAKVVEAQMKAESQIKVSEFKAETQAQLDRFEAILEAFKIAQQTQREAPKAPEVPQTINVTVPKSGGKRRITRTESGFEVEED